MFYGISLLWMVLATIVYFGIGAVWYSPVMFAKQWSEEIKRKKVEMSMAPSAMVTTFVCMLVLVAVEAYLVHATGTVGVIRGAYLGFKLWIGFVATTALVNSTFQGGSKRLFAIDQGYHLVGIVLAGAILAH
jgi:hypothetical protein